MSSEEKVIVEPSDVRGKCVVSASQLYLNELNVYANLFATKQIDLDTFKTFMSERYIYHLKVLDTYVSTGVITE